MIESKANDDNSNKFSLLSIRTAVFINNVIYHIYYKS